MCDKRSFRPAWTDTGQKYNTFKCPRCGYPQYCGCPSCVDKIPEGILPYTWKCETMTSGNVLELCICTNCGFDASIDYWMDESIKQYKEGVTK